MNEHLELEILQVIMLKNSIELEQPAESITFLDNKDCPMNPFSLDYDAIPMLIWKN